ncbi:MAG: NAD(P)-dependent oxidoreductase [Thermodesulfobacteriota bacterium]
MNKVLITAPYMLREREKVEQLFSGFSLNLDWAEVKERLGENELLSVIGKYDGIICGDDRFTESVIDAATRLRVIVKWGTGIDSIDKEYANKRNILVYNTPDAFAAPVADTTLGMILYFSRGLKQNDDIMKMGGWDKPQGYALSEKKIGIIGLGNIGTAVAKRLCVFGTTIFANDIVAKDPSIIEKYCIHMVSKEEIYEQCDFITLHCDLNESSHHLLNGKIFAEMKNTAYIINTSRGPIIKEDDLIEALREGIIAGVGLDVFEHEPLPADSPLRKMSNAILSSHNSNSSPVHWQNVHENSIKMLLKGLGIE